MIQVKINGNNKRTVINSLKCQILKEKNKLYLMRFKSLPVNKKLSNKIKLDLPQTVKAQQNQLQKKYIQSIKTNKLSSTNLSPSKNNSIQPYETLQFGLQNISNHLEQSRCRLKSLHQIQDQKLSQTQKRINTIQDKPSQSKIQNCLLNYIRRNLSLKQSNLKRDIDEIDKINTVHSSKMSYLKNPFNFKSNLTSANQYKQRKQYKTIKQLFEGRLSPNICKINRFSTQISQQQVNKNNIFKRKKIYENLQSQNSYEMQKNDNLVKSLKRYKQKYGKNTIGFKNSISPWRNGEFDMNP